MNVKAVVKVMNFHALLRVDASRRRAEKYEAMKDELESMMQIILNNRNLRLDKHIRLPDPSLPVLRSSTRLKSSRRRPVPSRVYRSP